LKFNKINWARTYEGKESFRNNINNLKKKSINDQLCHQFHPKINNNSHNLALLFRSKNSLKNRNKMSNRNFNDLTSNFTNEENGESPDDNNSENYLEIENLLNIQPPFKKQVRNSTSSRTFFNYMNSYRSNSHFNRTNQYWKNKLEGCTHIPNISNYPNSFKSKMKSRSLQNIVI